MAIRKILIKYSDSRQQTKTAHLGLEETSSWKDWWRGTFPLYLISEEIFGVVAAGEKLGGLGLVIMEKENRIVFSSHGEGGGNRRYTFSLLDYEKESANYIFKGKKGLRLTVQSELNLYNTEFSLFYDDVLTKNLQKGRDLPMKEITPDEVLKTFPTITLIAQYLDRKHSEMKKWSFEELISHSEIIPIIKRLTINEKSELAEKIQTLSQGLRGDLEKIGYDGVLQKFKGALEPEVEQLAKSLEEIQSDRERLEQELSLASNRKGELEYEADAISKTIFSLRKEFERAQGVQREIPDALEKIERAIQNGKSQLAGLIQGMDLIKEENDRLEMLLKKVEGEEMKGTNLEKINQYLKNGRTQMAGLVLAGNHIEEEYKKLEKLITRLAGKET